MSGDELILWLTTDNKTYIRFGIAENYVRHSKIKSPRHIHINDVVHEFYDVDVTLSTIKFTMKATNDPLMKEVFDVIREYELMKNAVIDIKWDMKMSSFVITNGGSGLFKFIVDKVIPEDECEIEFHHRRHRHE